LKQSTSLPDYEAARTYAWEQLDRKLTPRSATIGPGSWKTRSPVLR